MVISNARDPGSPNLRMVSWNLNTLLRRWSYNPNHPLTVSDFEVLSSILYRKITLWFVISCKTNRMSIEKTPRSTTHSLGLGPLPQSWVTSVLNIKEPPLKLPLKPETAIYKCLAIKLDDKTKKTIHTKLLHVELFFFRFCLNTGKPVHNHG